jgi:hypothetical protein
MTITRGVTRRGSGSGYGCPLTALRMLALVGLGAVLTGVGFILMLKHMPRQRYGK